MSFAAETQLGPYRIVSLIGSGGMGEVYRARDTRLLRDVALKVLPASFTNDPDRLRRFEQEARAVAALNHPNIVSVHDVGNANGVHYIVSELLEGETLRQRITASGMPARKAIDLATQLANGLAAAHEQDIVHRDLKPENVFITRSGRLKILDFGLAKLRRLPGTAENLDGVTVTETEAGQVNGHRRLHVAGAGEGQDPPIYLRSTTATHLPSPANVHAAMVEPVPPSRITRSNSSGCDFLRTGADGQVSLLFMRLFLSEHWASRSRV